jgi:Na+-transporting NADH:ubiquinone oxidoreductase subunit C
VHSNKYTIIYAVGLTIAVAVSLSLASAGLRSRQDANIARAQRGAILETVMVVSPETLEEDYNAYVTEYVYEFAGNPRTDVTPFELDLVRESRKAPEERLYPVYVFERQGQTRFILPIQGTGLWGPINAYLALDSDLNTISGVSFDHQGETPGLGAEITTTDFEQRFQGKRLFADNGDFASIRVVKGGGTESDPHAVDGLTGATMTMNGVSAMFADELALYDRIFQELSP